MVNSSQQYSITILHVHVCFFYLFVTRSTEPCASMFNVYNLNFTWNQYEEVFHTNDVKRSSLHFRGTGANDVHQRHASKISNAPPGDCCDVAQFSDHLQHI